MSRRWEVPLVDLVIAPEEIEEVAGVLRSGWLTMGPETERFEHEFAEYTGAAHAVAVTNGTAALHLALLAAGVGPGDEVIVPSLTFVATVAAIEYTGAEPVFVDIQGLDRPWPSARMCRELIGERTAAILAMAYGGDAGEIEGLRELARERGLALLEDAAHAVGSRLGGRHLGTFGQAGAFSFYSNKNLAIGEGGAVITDDAALADRLRSLRSHGLSAHTWERHGRVGEYVVHRLGYNYRIDEPRAALARARLARLEAENAQRRRLDRRYRELLEGSYVQPRRAADPRLTSACHLFTVTLPSDADRQRMRELMADRGVQTSIHYPPVHTFGRYRDRGLRLPQTEAYGERALTLPMFAALTDAQQDLVVDSLTRSLSKGS
jgi:dTDP-4-amino-4,6-dideoxygalactose transaminase